MIKPRQQVPELSVPLVNGMEETQWISEIKKENTQAFKSVYDQYADKVFYVALHFHLILPCRNSKCSKLISNEF